jgi:hypothetical protein
MDPVKPDLRPPYEPCAAPGDTGRSVRDLHVKGIPEAAWCRARCNATISRLSFKDYVIRLLDTCCPIQVTDRPSEPQ